MNSLNSRLHKQFDEAANRFKNKDVVWSVQIAQKMIENASVYTGKYKKHKDVIKVEVMSEDTYQTGT